MEKALYAKYLELLRSELVPAMGCTEPIAIAYASALARSILGIVPEKVDVRVSAGIIKNVKSVVVPHTGAKRGIAAAVAAGIVAGDADRELEVLSSVTDEQIDEITDFLARTECKISVSDKPYSFNIIVTVFAFSHTASVEIAGEHTNVIRKERDGTILFEKPYGEKTLPERDFLSVEGIVEFAENAEIDDIKTILDRQIQYNTAIALEGLNGEWGANIGKILLDTYGNDVHNMARAYAAAGSDARMSGCEKAVVINSGSGNQGLTASLPVIVYAKELNASDETLYRALVVSNLITIHLKTGIGCLSAYCGATSAGCGAGAGICYLYGGRFDEISHTVVNAVAINSGMICDGAKPSCAAKIASAVESGLLGMQMQRHGTQFYGGDGIVVKGVENTIRSVGALARDGMNETDRTIIRLMTEGC